MDTGSRKITIKEKLRNKISYYFWLVKRALGFQKCQHGRKPIDCQICAYYVKFLTHR